MEIKNKILLIIVFSTIFLTIKKFTLEKFAITTSSTESIFQCNEYSLQDVESRISEPVFNRGSNYIIYKGETGDKGEPGNMGGLGRTGPRGLTGFLGIRGPKGPQGPKGLGMTGRRGDTGPIGEKGRKGLKGLMGPKGNSSKLSLCAIPNQGDSRMRWNIGEDKPSVLNSCLEKNDFEKINSFMERQPRSGIYEILSKIDYTKILSHQIDKSNLENMNGSSESQTSNSISQKKQIKFNNSIPNENQFSNKRVIIERLNSKTGNYYNYKIYLYCTDENNQTEYNLTIKENNNYLEISHISNLLANKFVNFYSIDLNNVSNNLNINFKNGIFYPSYFIKYDNKFLKNIRTKIQLTTTSSIDNSYIFLLKRIGDIPN